jgi:Fe-S-cluster-containing hydrogenase component 2
VHGKKTLEEICEGPRPAGLRLRPKSRNCVGCLTCETVCMQAHTGRFGIGEARLRIESKPVEEEPPLNKVRVCTLCGKCIEACEPGALFLDEAGRIALKADRCNRCGLCAEACPFDVVFFNGDELPVICDLCGGSPQCVRWCKYEAIQIKTGE